MTLQQASAEFVLEQHIRGNTAKTVRYYTQCLDYFARFAGADAPMDTITPRTLKSYFMHLTEQNLSTISIQSYIRGVRAFLSWCYQEELIVENLPEKFHLPKAKRKAIDVLSDTEIRQLFACFNIRKTLPLRNACICSLMLDCGLRLNEVATLTLEHLRLEDGYAIVDGKGNKQRYVPLGLHTRKLLNRYIARRPIGVQTNVVFLQKNLSPVTSNTLQLLFRRLKKQANIPRLRAHLLRHTFATRYLENGGDIYTLQNILGHTTLEMVKRYVHYIPGKVKSTHPKYSPVDNLFQK